jgi:hypothetical protein
MSFTEDDKKHARHICESPELLKFIEKVFCPKEDIVSKNIKKNTLMLDDAEYGRSVKAIVIAESSFALKMQQLRRMGSPQKVGTTPRAPR